MRHLILCFFASVCFYSNAALSQLMPLEPYVGTLPFAIEEIRALSSAKCLLKTGCQVITRALKKAGSPAREVAIYAVGENYPDPNRDSTSERSWRVWAEVAPTVLVELTQGMSDRVFGERAICARLKVLLSESFTIGDGARSLIVRIGCEISGTGRGFIASDMLVLLRGDQVRMLPLLDDSQNNFAVGLRIGSSLRSDVRLTPSKEGTDTLLYRMVRNSWDETTPSGSSISYETVTIRGDQISRNPAPLSISREFGSAKALIYLSR